MPTHPHGSIYTGRSGRAFHNNGKHSDVTVYCIGAHASLTEIAETHCYAAQQIATTLATAQTLVQTAQRAQPLTSIQVIVLDRLRQDFLRTVLLSVQVVGITTIDELKHKQPLSQMGRQQRQHITLLVTRYLYQIHIILRR